MPLAAGFVLLGGMNKRRKRSKGEKQYGGIEQAVGRGLRAAAGAQVVSQLVSLGVLAVLYRQIEPAEFGLLGMVLPVLLFLRALATLGLNVAAVQKETLTPGQTSSLFWLNLLMGLAMAVVGAACGPLLAALYGEPRVAGVCYALAGAAIPWALATQHTALLERKLLFGRLAGARVAAQTAGGVAGIAYAIAGGGVWALVLQQYVELAALVVLVWVLEPWRPLRPGRGEPVGPLVRYGGAYTASGLMFFLAQNLDKFLLSILLGGTAAGRAAIGMYTQMANLAIKPVYLVTTPLGGIMLPALARALPERETFARVTAGFYRAVAILLFPVGIGLFVVARDVPAMLGGENWENAGQILQALALFIVAQGFIIIAGNVLAAAGRAGRLMIGSAIVALIMLQAYIAGYLMVGLVEGAATPLLRSVGVAWALTAATVLIVALPYTLFTLATARVPAGLVLKPLVRPLWAAVMMGVSVWALRVALLRVESFGPAARLAACVAAGALFYAIISRGELRWLKGFATGEAK